MLLANCSLLVGFSEVLRPMGANCKMKEKILAYEVERTVLCGFSESSAGMQKA